MTLVLFFSALSVLSYMMNLIRSGLVHREIICALWATIKGATSALFLGCPAPCSLATVNAENRKGDIERSSHGSQLYAIELFGKVQLRSPWLFHLATFLGISCTSILGISSFNLNPELKKTGSPASLLLLLTILADGRSSSSLMWCHVLFGYLQLIFFFLVFLVCPFS